MKIIATKEVKKKIKKTLTAVKKKENIQDAKKYKANH